MQTLSRTLAEYDMELLRIIANRWDVDLSGRDAKKAADALTAAMLNADKVGDLWARLPDDQRGALQTLLGAGGKMPVGVFGRMFGTVRPMGPDRLVREKPHLTPENIAEHLYYRGLIAQAFTGQAKPADGGKAEKGGKKAEKAGKSEGAAPTPPTVIYVPTDLAALIPAHITGFQLQPPAPPEPMPTLGQPQHVRQADTTVIDDLTALIAACQIEDIPLHDGAVPTEIRAGLKPYFLGSNSPARVAMMVGLAIDLGLLQCGDDTGGLLKPVSQTARGWLDSARPTQVRALADTWRRSVSYNELHFLPGLKVERADNDPVLARKAMLNFLGAVPPNEWWPTADLIDMAYDKEPEFQRPSGDYDSWYIRDAETNEYLRGFDSWEQVEGELLKFLLSGPMHGLGLIDLAQGGEACRLTVYGRALLGRGEWPTPAANSEGAKVSVMPDGLCLVPRTTNRFERFQIARFTEWVKAADPFEYRLTVDGIARARVQGLRPDQVLTFLRRVTGENVPEPVVKQLDLWAQAAGAESAMLSRMIVLRVPKESLMETLMNTPALRRFVTTTLGPTAVAVRANGWEALVKALKDMGIGVDVEMD